ncbi:hypothetical protein HZC09_02370 [Candidatus Micrarchaeota archaeon]|nr:hypothetical protein [Candidatus Micrarchaeota archaeon]
MEFVAGWQPLAIAAATLSLLVVGGAFCLGAVFDSRWLKAWARNEFFQVCVSCILMASLLAFAVGLNAFSQDLTGGQEPITFARGYLSAMNADISVYSAEVSAFTLVVSALRDVEVSIEPLGVGVSAKPLAGLNSVVNDAEFILSALSFIRLSNEIQEHLFVFIEATMMYYFLPVGVILRTFPLTRRVGAFMMAVAVGLYFVLPLTYVFNAAALQQTTHSITVNIEPLRQFIELYKLTNFHFLDPLSLSDYVIDLITNPFFDLVTSVVSSMAALVANLAVQTTFFPLFNLGFVLLFMFSLYNALSSESRWFSCN